VSGSGSGRGTPLWRFNALETATKIKEAKKQKKMVLEKNARNIEKNRINFFSLTF